MECTSSHLGSLISHCDSLAQLCEKQSHCSVDDNDHLGFMSLCFLSKQVDHMQAVLHLLPHPDVQLISRAMIEGLNQLLWCFNKSERAFQWRGYSWISDWRLSMEIESKRNKVPSDHKEDIDTFISEHGELYKINKYKNKAIPEGVDPFHKNWRCGKSLKQIAEDVQGEALYKSLYAPYSGWQHWDAPSIGQMITRDDGGILYGSCENHEYLCSSLSVAFQCLYQLMELNSAHHKLGIEKKLSSIREKYMKLHADSQ